MCLNTVYLHYIVIFLRNKLFETLIRVLIYANKETSLQQYFALKLYTTSYSSYPLFPSFETDLFPLLSLRSRPNQLKRRTSYISREFTRELSRQQKKDPSGSAIKTLLQPYLLKGRRLPIRKKQQPLGNLQNNRILAAKSTVNSRKYVSSKIC